MGMLLKMLPNKLQPKGKRYFLIGIHAAYGTIVTQYAVMALYLMVV
jgi:hypothetical protein